MFCESKSIAGKVYKRRVRMVMAGYFVLFLGTMWTVSRMHPVGWELYGLALLPTMPILAVFYFQGLYLHSEKDEYVRELTMRSLLFGTAGALAVVMYDGFLRIVGWHGQMPPFTAFWVFVGMVVLARATNKMANRFDESD
jgi:hypothetical protein